MTITKDDIDAIRASVQSLPPKAKTTPTLRDIIQDLEPVLRDALVVKRYSLTDIQQMLAKKGVPISASTLGSYLRAIAKSAPKTTRRKPAKPPEGGGNANGNQNLARVAIPQDEEDRLSALLSDSGI